MKCSRRIDDWTIEQCKQSNQKAGVVVRHVIASKTLRVGTHRGLGMKITAFLTDKRRADGGRNRTPVTAHEPVPSRWLVNWENYNWLGTKLRSQLAWLRDNVPVCRRRSQLWGLFCLAVDPFACEMRRPPSRCVKFYALFME